MLMFNWFRLNAGVHNRCGVDTYGLHVYVLLRNFDTRLLSFHNGHVNKPVFLMFYPFKNIF